MAFFEHKVKKIEQSISFYKNNRTFVVAFTNYWILMKVAKQFFGLFIVVATFMGCQSKASMPTNFSEKTGFDYNDEQNGFFKVNSVYEGKIPPGTVYISVMTTV